MTSGAPRPASRTPLGEDEAVLGPVEPDLEVDPDLATTHREVALFHFERGSHDAGSRHLERARVLDAEGPLPLASLAVVHAATGNGREARRLLEKINRGHSRPSRVESRQRLDDDAARLTLALSTSSS